MIGGKGGVRNLERSSEVLERSRRKWGFLKLKFWGRRKVACRKVALFENPTLNASSNPDGWSIL